MGRPLQSIFTAFLITLSFSKVFGNSRSIEIVKSNDEVKFDGVKDLPTSLDIGNKRNGSALPPRAETRFDSKPNNSSPRFLTPQNGQQVEEAEIEKLKQLANEKNSAVKNGQNNSVDVVQPHHQSAQENVHGNLDDGHSSIPLPVPNAIENETPFSLGSCIAGEDETRLCPEGYLCVGEDEGECIRLAHPQPPQNPSLIVNSKAPTDPEMEYEQGEFRVVLKYANQLPELWLKNAKWSCSKNDAKCGAWEKIYLEIRRYVVFIKVKHQFGAMGKVIPPVEAVAVRPRFSPIKLHNMERTQTNAIGKSHNFNRQRETTNPLYVEKGGMETVHVMKMVELAFEINKKGANIEYSPVYIMNEELVEKVHGWATFYADANKFLQTRKIEKIYKIVRGFNKLEYDKHFEDFYKRVGEEYKSMDNGKTFVESIIKTFEEFEQEKEFAYYHLRIILMHKQILRGFELADWKVPQPPFPVELDTLNVQEKHEFANLWEPIVDTLREEKAKNTVERYVHRQQMESSRIKDSVLTIPLIEEFVPIVYVYANGEPLGKDLAEALTKAENCLYEIKWNFKKQLAQLKAECPIPTNIEKGREEKFNAIVNVANTLHSGTPTFLDQNGHKMDRNDVLRLLDRAFNAIVSGTKFDVFVPTIQSRIKDMAKDYADKIQKQQVPEIQRKYQDKNWAHEHMNKLVKEKPATVNKEMQPIKPTIGSDGLTDAQRFFKKRYDEKKHDDEKLKKLKLEKEELEKKKKEMQKLKWAEKQKKDFEARKLEKEKLANEKLEKEKSDKEKKEMQKKKWAEQEKKHFEARKLEKEKLIAKEKLEKQNLRVHAYPPISATVKKEEKPVIKPASHRSVVAF